ncbi:serine hydrolase domain-containing protein [Paenibacillus marinisediminis]
MNIMKDIPEHHGLSSKALLQFMNHMERLNLEVNSFMLLQNGRATAQFWRQPYRKDCPQILFSLSKSVTSIAVGIAWDQGYLDLKDKVISFFPDDLPESISPYLSDMTIHHLLSMNAGHHDNIYGDVVSHQNWVKAFLSLDIQHQPGTYYRYSTPATYMLSAILEKVTGESLVDFLTPRLFEPLGISKPVWETCPMGVTAGGMGLNMPTEAIARFGQMLLDKGMYNGQRIVSERYITLATQEQSDNRRDEERMDWAQGYGYQLFLCRRGCYMGNGAFGQLCFVAPEQNIVIAATTSFKNMKQLQTLLDLIYEYIIERIDLKDALDPNDHKELEQLLTNMSYPISISQSLTSLVASSMGRCYIMEDNPHQLKLLNISLKDNLVEVESIYKERGAERLLYDLTKPVLTRGSFIKDLAYHEQEVVTYAAWLASTTLELTMRYIETPYVVTHTLKFLNDSIEFRYQINVSFGVESYQAIGRLHTTTPFSQESLY